MRLNFLIYFLFKNPQPIRKLFMKTLDDCTALVRKTERVFDFLKLIGRYLKFIVLRFFGSIFQNLLETHLNF